MKLLLFAFVHRTPQRHGREFFCRGTYGDMWGVNFRSAKKKKSMFHSTVLTPYGLLAFWRCVESFRVC